MAACDALHQALLSAFPDALVLTNADGQLVEVNPLAKELFDRELSTSNREDVACWFSEPAELQALYQQAQACSGWIPGRLTRQSSADPLRLDVLSVRQTESFLYLLRFHSHSSSSQVFQDLNRQLREVNQRLNEERTLRKKAQDNYLKLEKVALELANEIEHRLRVEKQLTTVLDAVGQGVVQVDNTGQMVMANKALSNMFGYDADELLGQPVDMLLPTELRLNHVKFRNSYMSEPVSRPMGGNRELSGRHKSGQLIPVEIGLNPVELDGVTHVVATVLDITERHRHQLELLLKTQALERSNQELNEFAYIASHDLKEPLRGISNYAGFLLEDYEAKLERDGKDMLQSLVRLSGRMEQLITELLNYSRIGQSQLQIQEVDVGAVIEDVLDTLQPRLSELNVSCNVQSDIPKVQADPVRLSEVFQNLISNAMKYNDKPDKRITIGCQRDKPQPVFFVQDNGIGVAPAYFEKIFKIFKRLHAQDQFQGGTGVGLTIVKKIIERHGGEIWVESSEGEGTTFYFTLSDSLSVTQS